METQESGTGPKAGTRKKNSDQSEKISDVGSGGIPSSHRGTVKIIQL